MEQILQLFKIDLGISHDKRDSYFLKLLESCDKELAGKGVYIHRDRAEDMILLSDYAAWVYRNRAEDTGISRNLKQRIINRQMKRRARS